MSEYTFNLGEDGGRYYARIYDPSDRWRTRLSLLTEQESVARQRLAEWERMAARGEWDPRDGRPRKGQRLPLEQAVTRFMEAYREDVRDVTARNMKSALSMLQDSLGGDKPIGHIRPTHIRSFIDNLSGHGKGAPPGSASQSTKSQKYSYLNRFFSWLHERGLLDRDLMGPLSRPKVDDAADTYEVLSPTEARRLLQACVVDDGPAWWRHFVELALASGLRLGELRHLKWSRVDLEALAEITPATVQESDVCAIQVEPLRLSDGTLWRPKNRYSHRRVLVYPRGAAVLRARWEAQDQPSDGWIFRAQNGTYKGRRPPRGQLQERMRKYGRTAGLRPQRQITIHDCRHTWFSWLLNDLGLARKAPAISEMGGHGQIEQTWGYVTAGEEAGREAVYESLGLTSPEGREEDVRAFLCGAPIGQQGDAQQKAEMPRSEG